MLSKPRLFIAFIMVSGMLGSVLSSGSSQAQEAVGTSAADQGFYFPAEFEAQEAVWMGWPTYENKAGWSVKDLHVQLWAAMAPQVYVNVAVNPDHAEGGASYDAQLAEIKGLMKKYAVPEDRIRFYKIAHADIWWRDMGPNYLVDGTGRRAAADFGFNGWGYEANDSEYARTEGAVDAQVARIEGLDPVFKTTMISEGGDREFNGKGVMLVVEAVEQQRNPTLTKDQMEAEFMRVLGVKKVIWLKQGRYDDDLSFAGRLPDHDGKRDLYTAITTGGHIDEHVRFVGPRTILYTEVSEAEAQADPIAAENKKRFEVNLAILKAATDQDGNPFELIAMPEAPTIIVTMQPGDGVYDYLAANDLMKRFNPIPAGQPIRVVLATSYLNFLVTNGVVLAQKYWTEGSPESWRRSDERAQRILQSVFPDRKIIAFDTRAINAGGGGIHCNTQQVPKAKKD